MPYTAEELAQHMENDCMPVGWDEVPAMLRSQATELALLRQRVKARAELDEIRGWHDLPEVAAALHAKVARLTEDAERERDSRAMFAARIERMQIDGEKWLTLVGVLTLLNDCDMLSTLSTKEQP